MHDQHEDRESTPTDLRRRAFLGAGAVGALGAALLDQVPAAQAQEAARGKDAARPRDAVLPRRVLGRTGVEVTILNLGTWKSVGLDRILRFAWANGVRYIDTAQSYGSEPAIGRWLQANPEVRKQIFLATKDHPGRPGDMLSRVDERLSKLQTDYIDLLFFHALGSSQVDWPKSKEMKEAVEAIKKTGKVKFVGFSTHDPRRAEQLQAAAEGGFIDVIMIQNNPWLAEQAPINRALDACHKRGIGLVSMKQIAGQTDTREMERRLPELKEQGLTPYQALLHAIWSDERFSAACVSMRNTDQVRDNAEAARKFKPMTRAQIERLRDACIAAGPTFCADCDGRCSRAAGTHAELGNLTRLLTYHEHHGYRSEARRIYGELTDEARRWEGADLAAAREACPNKLDFAGLLPRVDELLS
ncbi:MAG: aldo/keto reductase [Isosphaeraceae bacterium]